MSLRTRLAYVLGTALLAIGASFAAVPAHAAGPASPAACTATVTPGAGSYGNAILYDSPAHLIDAEYWIQVSSGPGCTRYTRTVGNLFFHKGNGYTPVNGGANGRPNIFRNGTLISNNPPISFGSSGTDGEYFFVGNWIPAPNGSLHKAGINMINVSAEGSTYWLYLAWSASGSYHAPN